VPAPLDVSARSENFPPANEPPLRLDTCRSGARTLQFRRAGRSGIRHLRCFLDNRV
jgi:hypothetical protein